MGVTHQSGVAASSITDGGGTARLKVGGWGTSIHVEAILEPERGSNVPDTGMEAGHNEPKV
jgi:hypothetical protein